MIALVFLCRISTYAYDFYSGGIYYNITSSTTVEVTYRQVYYTDYHSMYYRCGYFGDVIIPPKVVYNGITYSVTRIGNYAFATQNWSNLDEDMNRLKSIQLPSTLESIGELAFWSCHSLTTVSIPASVMSIENAAFVGCLNVKTFFVQASVPPISNYGFNISPFGYDPTLMPGKIIVPQKKPYLADSNWSQYGNRIVELVTFEKVNLIYDGVEHEIKWGNNLPSCTMEVSGNMTEKNAGYNIAHICIVCSSGQGEIYANCSIDFKYTIKKAPLYVSIENVKREYGEENPPLNIQSITGFINGEDVSVIDVLPNVVTVATRTSNVGTYPITINGGNATNYEFISIPGELTVTKAPLSAKVHDETRAYGKNNPSFTLDYYGLKNGEISPKWVSFPTFQTDAIKDSGVGQYSISATNGILENYSLNEIASGILSIIPAPLTIIVNNTSKEYYEPNPTFSFRCKGFANGENESVLTAIPTLSTTATRSSNVGTYEIICGETDSPNYSISYVNGKLTITPRTLRVSVGNYERLYNEDNPVFDLTYVGFVGNENENVLNTKPIAVTNATKGSDVGTYSINISGGNADNYLFSYSSGVLTISKAYQSIIWEQDLSIIGIGDQVELKAKATSGLPVTYTIEDNSIAEIYKIGNLYYLDCKKRGETQIVVLQDGNKNYYSSSRMRRSIVIGSEHYKEKITLSAEGYATFYDSKTAYTLPANLTACVVSAVNDNKLTYTDLKDAQRKSYIPKGVAVMIKNMNRLGGTFTLTQIEGETPTYVGENLLCGSDEAIVASAAGDSYFYKLAYGAAGTDLANVFGWYWGAANGGSFLIEGHKAWLAIPKEQAHKIRAFNIEGDATAIADLEEETSEAETDNVVYYDLQGRRINKPTRKGIYIRNGKKVAFAK